MALAEGGKMNVFLGGASGYIGGSVAVRLVRAGYKVRGPELSCSWRTARPRSDT